MSSSKRAREPPQRKTLSIAFDEALEKCREREEADFREEIENVEEEIFNAMAELMEARGYHRYTQTDEWHEDIELHADAFKGFEEAIAPWIKAMKQMQVAKAALPGKLAELMIASRKLKRYRDAPSSEEDK
jgi:wobble nucleotide-excising tRNase